MCKWQNLWSQILKVNINQTNKYIAPKVGEYTLDIRDKTINETILTYKNKNINALLEIMDEFPLNKYSHKLQGSDMYYWEA